MTDDEVKDLATRILNNEIFTSQHIAPGDVESLMRMIFMPLGFMDRKAVLEMKRKQRPGMFWAPMASAGPRAINGYPIFFELHMVSEEDTIRVWSKFKELKEALDNT